jgi:hypothetical protein
VLGVGIRWYVTRQSLFVGGIAFPNLRFRGYESLPTHANGNGNGVREEKPVILEDLKGWRLWMGVLQGVVLLGLTIVHTVILLQDGTGFLRFVFLAYWVFSIRN